MSNVGDISNACDLCDGDGGELLFNNGGIERVLV